MGIDRNNSFYIVGLGNPGDKYKRTRHNAGFEFLDLLSSELRSSWTEEKRAKYLISNIRLPGGTTLRMIKPMSYMNLSGGPLLATIKFYKDLEYTQEGNPINLLAVHDELDFKPGVFKLKVGGGAGGHKGIESIIGMLGTQAFYRYRIGIGHPRDLEDARGTDVVDWVLSRGNKEEADKVNDLNAKVANNLSKQLLCRDEALDFYKILASSVLV